MKIPKTLAVGLSALAVASTSMAATFFDSSITLQGKTIDLGNAGRVYKWSALSTNGNVSSVTSIANEVNFDGNVGVWGSSSNLILTQSRIKGDLYIRQGATPVLTSGSGYSGTKFQNAGTDAILSTAAANATTLSSNIQALTATTNFSLSGFTNNTPSALTKIIANNNGTGDNTALSNLVINGTVNNPLNNPIVLKLTDFNLSDLNGGTGTQLTLVGTAATKFIIDVSGQFGLGNSADIILSGGLLASNVIFNARSTTGASLTGASTLSGIVVANNGAFTASGASIVSGMVVGKSIALSSSSKIKNVSP
ncbi:MAG: hypothetical protein WCF18_20620 [Chthoniobacteraceae bacterium]